jgi:hypothetical protein
MVTELHLLMLQQNRNPQLRQMWFAERRLLNSGNTEWRLTQAIFFYL